MLFYAYNDFFKRRNFMLDTLPGIIVERAIPSDVWGGFDSEFFG